MSTRPLTQRLFIGGTFTDGTGSETFDVISPATGEQVGTISVAAKMDRHMDVWRRTASCRSSASPIR